MSDTLVLLADTDAAALEAAGAHLAAHGCEVLLARSGAELARLALDQGCDVAVVALSLPDADGLDAARMLLAARPDAIVILAAQPDELAGRADELLVSPFPCLQKPLSPHHLLLAVRQAAEIRRLRDENRVLHSQLEETEAPDDFVAENPRMIETLRQAATAAESSDPVLLCGAPGTEKDILALYIHRCSPRADGPFVRFVCGRMSSPAEEAELFGRQHPGRRNPGRLQLASGGSLFLDNVTELAAAAQARLLRFLDDQRIVLTRDPEPDALDMPLVPHVRILASTSFDLNVLARAARLRKDLFFRLCTLAINIPPLRERPEDVLPLARRFLARFALEAGKGLRDIGPEAAELLERYDWPGNTAELRDVIRSAVAAAEHNLILPRDLAHGPSRSLASRTAPPPDRSRTGASTHRLTRSTRPTRRLALDPCNAPGGQENHR